MSIFDERGLVWELYPEGIDEDETRQLSKRWLDALKIHLPVGLEYPRITSIVHQGHLAKRGLLNTAFRRRWFVLNSQQKVSTEYY